MLVRSLDGAAAFPASSARGFHFDKSAGKQGIVLTGLAF